MCAQVYKILITCGDTNNGLMFQKLSAKWVSKQIIEFMNILATDAWHRFTKETSIRQTRKSWIKIQHQDILRTWYPHNSAKLKLLKNDRMFWSQINRVETNWKLVQSLERYTHWTWAKHELIFGSAMHEVKYGDEYTPIWWINDHNQTMA